MKDSFEKDFKELTGFPPFKWQKRLFYERFAKGDIPSALDIPTGLGKTSVMVIWYLARKAKAALPRRLVYVVDRRAVVDQATTVADEIKKKSKDDTLRVSTLRGQHVDNREWLADPVAPAIIVGTVDMIGSRLLFSGYGVSRKMRPYHAGLLGADTLVVLDEAHLVPPFEKLLEKIAKIVNGANVFGPREQEDRRITPPLKLLSLSATGRENDQSRKGGFSLLREDWEDEVVKKRLEARKRLTIQVLNDAEKLAQELAERAWKLGEKPARVLVYCDRRKDAVEVKNKIDKKFEKGTPEPVSELLVGGRRVFERQTLSDWLKEYGFFGDAKGSPKQPTFLIATSAGEVGVDLDADHMVCDLVEWERMVQRLGRVNRRGNGDARIEVVAAPRTEKPSNQKKAKEWEKLLACFRKPLDSLRCVGVQDERDASPGALLELKERAENHSELRNAIEAATTPVPLRPALTRALVDAWSMTSLDEHTGRPDDIQPWLRGWEEDPQPQTTVVWRKYLPVRANGTETEATKKEIEAFFEAAPPHTSEKLEIETGKIVGWFSERAEKQFQIKKTVDSAAEPSESDDNSIADIQPLLKKDICAYVLSPAHDLLSILKGHDCDNNTKVKEYILPGSTLIVDARFGGLSEEGMLAEEGMLDENASGPPRTIDDDENWLPDDGEGKPTIRFRVRHVTGVTESDSTESKPDSGWRERLRFDLKRSEEGEATKWLLVEKWRDDSETGDDRSIGRLQELCEHHAWTEAKARKIANALDLPDSHIELLAVAARLHDKGKQHSLWQRAAKAPQDGKIYAKTDKRMNVNLLNKYRHEFGSLPFAKEDADFKALPADLQELSLHLIATHHGYARPVISTSGCDDPPSVLEKRARDVALRFAQMQKRWGPWGLAWWESLLRAADQQASRDNDDPNRKKDN